MRAAALDQIATDAVSRGEGDRVSCEVAYLAGVISQSPRLARALSQAMVPVEAKMALLRELTENTFLEDSLLALVSVDITSVRTQSAYLSIVFDTALQLVINVAKHALQLDELQSSLDLVSRTIRDVDTLSDALRSPDTIDEVKMKVIADVFASSITPSALALVKLVIAIDHGRDVATAVDEMSRQIVDASDRVLADVTTAVDIDDDRKVRLVRALSTRMGKQVKARFHVDPKIMGSVIVRVGDEIWDGSVRTRLEQARTLTTRAS